MTLSSFVRSHIPYYYAILGPILVGMSSGRGSDDSKHPFGRVLVATAGIGSMSFNVAGERLGFLADISKVYRLASKT